MAALQHGFTVEPTSDLDLNRVQQRLKLALDKLAAAATSSQLTDKTRWVAIGSQDLQNQVRGSDVASNAITACPAAYQHLTGTNTINFIQSNNWFDGARVEFFVVNGLTLNHHAVGGSRATALPMQLLSGAATAKAAGSVIAFRLDYALGFWLQVV